ncbi:unnamed protein product [Cuscuta epithymum]|uniref:Uncharacterized protein n=1 Tax=Cuscuta epithymum TaxID=186058 RepID=A0AAV0ERQ9_9ASTE|nr:unnamed protein product [Cuscuta epithymum]
MLTGLGRRCGFPLQRELPSCMGLSIPLSLSGGATPSKDREALAKLEDESLEAKIIQASVTASVALGEHIRRLEQMPLRKIQSAKTLKMLVVTNTEAVRKMAELEETLRLATEGMDQSLKDAEAKCKAIAEKAAAEEAQKAATKAEADK